jgi:hypothetical protein
MSDNHLISKRTETSPDGTETVISTYRFNGKIITRSYVKVKKDAAKKRGPKLGSKHKPDPIKMLEKMEQKKAEIEEIIARLRNQTITTDNDTTSS